MVAVYLTGRNSTSGALFPVSVITNTTLVLVATLELFPGKSHSTDIVIGVDTSGLKIDDYIGLLVIVSAHVDDIMTHTMFRPRVYDEWGLVVSNEPIRDLRIEAPLTRLYWATPRSLEIDIRLTQHFQAPPNV